MNHDPIDIQLGKVKQNLSVSKPDPCLFHEICSGEHNLPDSPFASPTKSAAFAHESFPAADTENTASRIGVDSGSNTTGGGNHLRPPTLDIPSPRPYFFPMHRLSSDHGAMGM
jgi:hypothetical protein